ncbi:MAG: 2'-5' RNA ligase family protein [Polyangiales bacterium]
METVRAYAACLLDLPVTRRLAGLSANLRRAAKERGWEANFVGPAALHVTLAVLDDVDLGLLDPVADALAQTARAHPPFRLQLGAVRGGEDPEAPRFLHVTLGQGAEAVEALAAEVTGALEALGVARTPPPPRVLLARVRRATTPLRELLRGGEDLGACTLSELVLYRADRARPDAEPPVVARVPLLLPRSPTGR